MVIYGVTRGVEVFPQHTSGLELNVDHSPLFKEIKSMKNLEIGILLPPPESGIKDTDSKVYEEIYEKLRKKNRIHFLEDEDTLKIFEDDIPRAENELEELKNYVKVSFTFFKERTEKILRKISENDLDTAFIDNWQAYYMASNGNLDDKILIESISEEKENEIKKKIKELSKTGLHYLEVYKVIKAEESPITLELLPPSKLSEDERERLRIIEGVERVWKVLNSKTISEKPDYIGSWYPVFPIRGYFELFIKEKDNGNVKGVIKDFCGDAKFEGKITDEKVEFVKVYTSPIKGVLGGPIKDEIIYEGKKVGELYKGMWRCKNLPGYFSGMFIMSEYSSENLENLVTKYS